MKNVLEIVIEKCLQKKTLDKENLSNIKRWAAKKFKISLPSNIDLIKVYHKLVQKGKIKEDRDLERILRKRKVRSLSGVAVVSVLVKPYPCPGECIFCPTEKGIPKSYLSGEPAVERAKKLNFSPFLQVKKRIEMLQQEGHPTDKIELRIIGGTFSFYPKKYKNWFLKNCFGAANIKEKSKIKSLKNEQKLNEGAYHKIVGISIETRPDFVNENEISNLRGLGVTMVELGVQSVFDEILTKSKVGYKIKTTIRATQLLKDAGFKVMYQMMPNLPGSTLKKDLQGFKTIFENPNFKPDWLKIYPCLVCKGSKLYQIWKQGKFSPYSDRELINLLTKIKEKVPYFVRIARIFRDIPAQKIEAGSKISNLREVVLKKMKEKGERCHCVRCREVKEEYSQREKIYLFKEEYEASKGKEIFLSFENKKRTKLLSFLRLRIPSQVFSKERHFILPLQNVAIIREIHTYGELVPIGRKIKIAPQHKGLGKKLTKMAENIAQKKFSLSKIAVISGVGVRNYWRGQGYRLRETYMIKKLI